MKRLMLTALCLSFMAIPLFGDEAPHVNRGHNQVEIEGLQSIDISPVLEIPTAGTLDMKDVESGEIFHVSKTPLLTLKDFSHGAVTTKNGMITLNLDLTTAGGKAIRDFTSKNIGKKLAFIVDGKLLKVPKIRDTIDGSGLSIDPLEKDVAAKLAVQINSRVN